MRAFGVEKVLREIAETRKLQRAALYGEVYGRGVQDLHYGGTRKDTPGFAVFDIAVDEAEGRLWLPQEEVGEICVAHGLTRAPVLTSTPH